MSYLILNRKEPLAMTWTKLWPSIGRVRMITLAIKQINDYFYDKSFFIFNGNDLDEPIKKKHSLTHFRTKQGL